MHALWRGFVLWEERNAGVTLWGNVILFLTKLFMVYPKWVPWKSPTQISPKRIYRKWIWLTTILHSLLSVESGERIWNRCQSNWSSVKVVVGQSNWLNLESVKYCRENWCVRFPWYLSKTGEKILDIEHGKTVKNESLYYWASWHDFIYTLNIYYPLFRSGGIMITLFPLSDFTVRIHATNCTSV